MKIGTMVIEGSFTRLGRSVIVVLICMMVGCVSAGKVFPSTLSSTEEVTWMGRARDGQAITPPFTVRSERGETVALSLKVKSAREEFASERQFLIPGNCTDGVSQCAISQRLTCVCGAGIFINGELVRESHGKEGRSLATVGKWMDPHVATVGRDMGIMVEMIGLPASAHVGWQEHGGSFGCNEDNHKIQCTGSVEDTSPGWREIDSQYDSTVTNTYIGKVRVMETYNPGTNVGFDDIELTIGMNPNTGGSVTSSSPVCSAAVSGVSVGASFVANWEITRYTCQYTPNHGCVELWFSPHYTQYNYLAIDCTTEIRHNTLENAFYEVLFTAT